MRIRNSEGSSKLCAVASEAIGLSADRKTLYFCPLCSRHIYSVPTKLLHDPNVTEQQFSESVKDLGEKGPSDGLEADSEGAKETIVFFSACSMATGRRSFKIHVYFSRIHSLWEPTVACASLPTSFTAKRDFMEAKIYEKNATTRCE